MLERNPGAFPPGSTMENLTNVPHALLRELFVGRSCALWQALWSLITMEVPGFVPAEGRRMRSDWPPRSLLSCSLSGITFKPRGALLPVLAVGGRGLTFCCVALLHSSHLCQGPWGLEVSRNSLVFQRWPCEAGDSGSYLSFPSKALLREKFLPIPVQ